MKEHFIHYQFQIEIEEEIREAYFEFLVKPEVHPGQTLFNPELHHQPEGKISHALNRYQHETYQLRIGHHFDHLKLDFKARAIKQLPEDYPESWADIDLLPAFELNNTNARQFYSFLRNSPLTKMNTAQLPEVLLSDKKEPPLRYLLRLQSQLLDYLHFDDLALDHAQAAWESRKTNFTGFVHLMIAILRFQNIPARAVSFYYSDSARQAAQSIEYGLEVACQGGRWLLIDPARQQIGHESHLKIAHGRDCEEIPSVKSFFRGNTAQCNQLIKEQADFCYEIFHKQPQQ